MRIFIGYEEAHPEMYQVCKASIERFSSLHVIKPIRKKDIEEYTRPFQGEATDFAFSRFLVPYLTNYSGWALFCDGDFMWRCDPQEIEDYVKQSSQSPTVWVVKHPQFLTTPSEKMNGKANMSYPKKYWSSLMYFNNAQCLQLSSRSVNYWTGKQLHEMEWADEIGELPAEYNAMVNYYNFPSPKAIHFTDGGPWQDIHDNILYSNEWKKHYNNLLKIKH